MKRQIRIRKHCRENGWNPAKVQLTENAQVLVYTYIYEGDALLIAHNLSGKPVKFKFKNRQFHSWQLVDIFVKKIPEPPPDDNYLIALDKYGYRWFRVNGLKT